MAYDFIDQDIVASALIQPFDNDSFYNPVPNSHTGYAFDGKYYRSGIDLTSGYGLSPYGSSLYGITVPLASWYIEFLNTPNQFRGDKAAFPSQGIVLLSAVSLTILDDTVKVSNANQLPLWMIFLLNDAYALTSNYNSSTQSFTPSGLTYANGVISVLYRPDTGNQGGGVPPSATSTLVVSLDFTKDRAFLDVAFDAWQPDTAYATGSFIFDSNSSQQKATTGGTSGTVQPTWNTVLGGTTSEVSTGGTVIWTRVS